MFALAMVVLERLGDGLWNAIQMAWEIGWALVLVTRALEAQAPTHAEAARTGHQHTMAVAEDVPWRSRITSLSAC